MTEIKTIENLLSQVKTIADSYERVAKATGDNFNIFSILGIEHYEVTTHSRFIAHLLNPNALHGKGVLFLEEFLEKIQMPEHLDLETTKVKTEHNIGLKVISGMESTGGSIDIYLYDGFGKSISIENKIYASDQEKQIVRYQNHNKGKNIVLYLTLFEDDTDEFSKGELKSNKETENDADFHCISYKININNWLSECQKIAVDNPTLRETIKQYRNLVKKLTNQNINTEMDKEILKLITESEDKLKSAQKINSALSYVDTKLKLKLDEIILKGETIKNKYEENKIYNNIKLVPRFPYNGKYVIRFDFFFVNTQKDVLVYQIHTNDSKLCLETLIWGEGSNYEKIEDKMNLDENFIDQAEYKYDSKIDDILNEIDANVNTITEYLNISS